MPFVLADRVKETSLTTGTGPFILAGPMTDYQGFVAGIGNFNVCYYCAVLPDSGEWEVGVGTVVEGTPDQLTRNVVRSSSNGGLPVNFSAGTKEIFIVHDAGSVIYKDTNGLTRIGGDENYVQVLMDGEIRLYGTARVIDDYLVHLRTVSRDHPTNPPLTSKDGFDVINFDDTAEESVKFKIHIPTDSAPDEAMNMHLDWFVDDVDTEAQRAVVWGLEFKAVQHGAVFDFSVGTTTVFGVSEIPTDTADGENLTCDCLEMPPGDLPGEGLVLCRLFRYTGHEDDDHDGDARLAVIRPRHIKDRLGTPT